MKFVFAAAFVFCFVAAHARIVIEWEPEFEQEYAPEVPEVPGLQDAQDGDLGDLERRYRCRCCSHGCSCSGKYDGVKVTASFQLDEVEQGKEENVVATLIFGKKEMSKKFEVGKVTTVCGKAKGKEICADFDFRDKNTKDNMLDGCVEFTKPTQEKPVCFKLPRMTDESEDDDDSYDQSFEDEDIDVYFE